MKIRKYVARNMPEALRQVRDDLGEQAVILSTRQLARNNRFNVHDEARVEVTAAFDEQDDRRRAAQTAEARLSDRLGSPADPANPQNAGSFVARRYAGARPPAPAPSAVAGSPAFSKVEQATDSSAGLLPAVGSEELLQELRRLQDAVGRIERRSGPALAMPAALRRLVERLRNVGLAPALIDELLEALFAELTGTALDERAKVGERAAALLVERMPACRAIKLARRRQVIGFFGAAGAGKTTAVAKIAAGFASKNRERVLLISADNRRVGALEQMQAFARQVGVPLEAAFEEEEVAAVLARYPDVQLVLLDFSSCGPYDRQERERQRRLAAAAGVDEMHLVLDARSSLEHMLDQLEASAEFSERRLLFTKMDEIVRAGAVLSAAASSQLPTSYFTTGMVVPGQIEAGNLGRLVARTMGVSSIPPMRG